MKAITQISEFKEGADIRGFFLCVEKHLRNTRSGDLYLDLVLRDRTGQINAKLWKEVSEYHKKFSAGDAVVIAGQVDVYLDKLQLNIKKINVASVQSYGRYGYDPALIVPSAKSDVKQMWQELTSYIKKIDNKYLKMLVNSIYKEYKSKLLTHPASVVMHHNYRSGLLEHTLSMAQTGIFLAKHYRVDTDLLMTGIFLHDIGKVKEITSELEASYSDEGNLIGHIVLGRDIAIKVANKIKDFPPDLLQKVEHLILSHQGQYEWQSPKKPKLREALLLHLIDNMDAKMNLMEKAIVEDVEEGKWTSRRNYFRIQILKDEQTIEDDGSK
ncbi:MAG: HD domain-containing protein [Planctomycetia bacterium]|nr:HD domain-containing protein [Planctomycetia bacterium]